MFSARLPPHAEPNALTRAREALAARGVQVADLTESNPTRVDIPYPDDLLRPLSDEAALEYRPHSLGAPAARAAIAQDHRRRGAIVDPAHVVLATSTSEGYSWLFKLLCDPGESVLVPQPSYPLFDYLARLEGIRLCPYPLDYHARWTVDVDAMNAAPDDVRAVVLVSPNNPTGSYVTPDEVAWVSQLCGRRGWALIVDEVFADYPLDAGDPVRDVAARSPVLSFSLAGLSKSVGLPQVKLGWIVVGGPAVERDAALAALEIVADTYLSVGTPVQVAAPALLAAGASVRDAIRARVRQNLAVLRRAARDFPACDVLRTEGGWSAVIRVPSMRGEEHLVVELLERERILVHPGYFFDFARETYLVVSLLPRPDLFADAIARLFRFAST